MELIGPEIINVSLKDQSNNNLSRIVLNDLRIPNVPKPATPNIGTFMEIVRDSSTGQQNIFKVILTTGQVESATKRITIQLATIDASVPLKIDVQLQFQHLRSYLDGSSSNVAGSSHSIHHQPPAGQADLAIQKVGPVTLSSSTPLSTFSIMEKRIDGSPAIYKVKPNLTEDDYLDPTALPKIILIGDFKVSGSTGPSLLMTSPSSTNAFNPSGGGEVEETPPVADKTRLLAIVKGPPPNRSQKLICEVRGKQTVKKSVMESRWVVGVEIMEDLLWDECGKVAQQRGGMEWTEYCGRYVDGEDLSDVLWVYRKEWWTLVLLSAITLGFIRGE